MAKSLVFSKNKSRNKFYILKLDLLTAILSIKQAFIVHFNRRIYEQQQKCKEKKCYITRLNEVDGFAWIQ